ncbi:hypothetical protein [Peribacillus simplex]|uniref:hypothetical protein n=1 Tax=Peribacillus simplex TaxID=1478 RepID=UPI003D274253
MGRAKDELMSKEERGNHLERCMKCGAVLRGNEERNSGTCEKCFKRAIEKD